MSTSASCRFWMMAVGIAAVAAGAARTSSAQGARAVARGAGAAATGSPGAAAPESARLEPARGILHQLVGTWRFDIWFAGNFGGAPDVSGARVMTPLFDDLRVQWSERLDHSEIQGQGIIGFDPGSGRFFSTAVYSAGSAPEFLTGTLDGAEPLVTFTPIATSPDSTAGEPAMHSFNLTMLDHDHFRVAALDHGWRGVFTRQP